MFLAGQIGLDPASMKLVSGALSQARLSLQHIHTVLKASKSSLATGIIGTCYYTTEEGGQCARQAQALSSGVKVMTTLGHESGRGQV